MKSSSWIPKCNKQGWINWGRLTGPLNGAYGVCNCVYRLNGKTYCARPDCPNCFGYGIMPIPWSELNK